MKVQKPISGRLVIDWPFETKKIYRCLQDTGGLIPGEQITVTSQNFVLQGKDENCGSGFRITARRVQSPKTKFQFQVGSRVIAESFFKRLE